MSNTADPIFREVKERQGGPQVQVADLFRLDSRTIISKLDFLTSHGTTRWRCVNTN